MSSKSELQEYLHVQGLSLPKYTSVRTGGADHEPIWESTVEVNGKETKGSPRRSKKAAESSAAFFALSQSTTAAASSSSSTSAKSFLFERLGICFLVDVENKPRFIERFIENFNTTNIIIKGIFSEKHTLTKRLLDLAKSDGRIELTPVKDAADTGLIFHAGQMTQTCPFNTYIIVSNAHFADALVDIFKQFAPNLHKVRTCYNFESVGVTLQELIESDFETNTTQARLHLGV